MLGWLTAVVFVTWISFQSLVSFFQPFFFWFLHLSIFLVYPLRPLASFLYGLPLLYLLALTVPPPTTIRPLLRCLPVWRAEAPAEGDILTVSCYAANKRAVLNDELLLCKWPLTDTVSAQQSPIVRLMAAAAAVIVIIFMIAGTSERREVTRGYTGWVGLFTAQWMTLYGKHSLVPFTRNELTLGEYISDTLVLKVKKLLVISFMGMTYRSRHYILFTGVFFQILSDIIPYINPLCTSNI